MKKEQNNKIHIIGAGVIGLSSAFELLKNGFEVTIYDSNKSGNGASNKSAGMLAGGVELEPGEENLWEINKISQNMWKSYQHELYKLSNIDIELNENGIIVAGFNKDDIELINKNYAYQKSIGVKHEFLNATSLKKLEPYLDSKLQGGILSKNDWSLDSTKLIKALKTCVLKKGAKIIENSKVNEIKITNNKVSSIILSSKEKIKTNKLLIAYGVGNIKFNSNTNVKIPPVRPLKGQMIVLKMDKKNPILKHTVWGPKVYLVPKKNGDLLIGATIEEQGFNKDLTAGGIYSLLEAAWRAVPAIEDLKIKKFIVGHRPTSIDDAPILGKSEIDGLFWACGHHRNGILLTPFTGKTICSTIINNKNDILIKKFTIDRF